MIASFRTAEVFTNLQRQLGPVNRVLLLLWLVLMILTPAFLRFGSPPVLALTLTFATMAQVGLVLGLLTTAWNAPRVFGVGMFVAATTWIVEYAGVRTGLPFGAYAYTSALQPQIGGVPAHIPAAWLMMLPPAWAVGKAMTRCRRTTCGRSWHGIAAHSLVSGLAMTVWDLYLDPQMVSWQLWQWDSPGIYFGVPLLNFAGWTLTAFCITLVLEATVLLDPLPVESLLLVYSLVWMLEAVGLGLFFRLPGAAATGFLGMGIFVAIAWHKLLATPA